VKPIIVGFAGPIASGKSTVAIALADALGWHHASFGEFVRSVARKRGLREDRETLQTVGSELISAGWEPFCSAVLSQAGWKRGCGVVIDGIRHIEAIEALRRIITPLEFVLVFISIIEVDRRPRLSKKGIASKEDLRRIESHSTEAQVSSSLRDKANFFVDGNRPVSEIVDQIIGWLNRDV